VGVMLAVVGIVMFSAKAVLVKLAYGYGVDAVSLLLLRMVFALPIYLLIGLRQWRSVGTGLRAKDHLALIVLGIVGYYLASYFDFYGLQFITASLERLILFIYPTLVVFISALFFKKRITKKQMLAVPITYFGVFIAFYHGVLLEGEQVYYGGVFIFLSALTYAVYLAGSGQLIPKLGPVFFTAYAMVVSCIAVIAHYLITNEYDLLTLPKPVYGLGFAMAIISTVIPSFLISEAIKRMGASNFAIIGSVGPVSTIILAAIFLGERITAYQIIGTAIVIVGVWITNLGKEQEVGIKSTK
jgi:drug/metabolite transporter (DMT)-like permease